MFIFIHFGQFVFKRPVNILDRMFKDTIFGTVSSFELLNLLFSAVHNFRSRADDRERLDVLVEGFSAESAMMLLNKICRVVTRAARATAKAKAFQTCLRVPLGPHLLPLVLQYTCACLATRRYSEQSRLISA